MSGTKQQQLARKEAEYRLRREQEAIESLTRDPGFLLFIGRLLQRCGLTDAHDTNNGSEAFKIMGRRQVAVETLAELQRHVPDAYERVLRERRNYLDDLKKLKLTPEEEQRHEEDN